MVCSSSRFFHRSSRISADTVLVTPAAVPSSTAAWRIHLRSVSALIPSRPATAVIAAYSDGYSPACSRTSRIALALVSWLYLTGMNVTSFRTLEVCTKSGAVQTSPHHDGYGQGADGIGGWGSGSPNRLLTS